MKLSSVAFFLALFFFSCNSRVVFEDYKTFENKVWNADSLVVFNASVSDTTIENKLKVKVRHTVDYEYQNLFLFISKSGEVTDTVELFLADKSGKWLGSGIGDIREFEYDYDQVNFKEKGDYLIRIEQAMRYGSLEKIQFLNAVEAIGLRVEKTNE